MADTTTLNASPDGLTGAFNSLWNAGAALYNKLPSAESVIDAVTLKPARDYLSTQFSSAVKGTALEKPAQVIGQAYNAIVPSTDRIAEAARNPSAVVSGIANFVRDPSTIIRDAKDPGIMSLKDKVNYFAGNITLVDVIAGKNATGKPLDAAKTFDLIAYQKPGSKDALAVMKKHGLDTPVFEALKTGALTQKDLNELTTGADGQPLDLVKIDKLLTQNPQYKGYLVDAISMIGKEVPTDQVGADGKRITKKIGAKEMKDVLYAANDMANLPENASAAEKLKKGKKVLDAMGKMGMDTNKVMAQEFSNNFDLSAFLRDPAGTMRSMLEAGGMQGEQLNAWMQVMGPMAKIGANMISGLKNSEFLQHYGNSAIEWGEKASKSDIGFRFG